MSLRAASEDGCAPLLPCARFARRLFAGLGGIKLESQMGDIGKALS